MNNDINNMELQALIDNIPAGICVFKVDGDDYNLAAANSDFFDIAGINKNDKHIEAAKMLSVIDANDSERVTADIKDIFKASGTSSTSFKVNNPNTGEDIWIHVEAKSIIEDNGKGFVYFNYNDITGERMMFETLRKNRLKYEAAANQAHLTFWEYDINNHRIISDNESFSRYSLGNTVENVPYSVMDYFDESSRSKLLALYKKLDEGVPEISADLWYSLKNGELPHCERITYTTMFDDNGRPISAFGIGQDVTAEKLAEEEYTRYLQDMYTANSKFLCAFILNLTANTCSDAGTYSSAIQNELRSETVDGLFNNTQKLMINEDEKIKFSKQFNRDKLIKDFSLGKNMLSVKYRRKNEEDNIVWVTNHIKMAKKPDTGEIEAFIYTTDASDEIKEEAIIRNITGEDYDFIALMDVKTERLTFRSISTGSRKLARFQSRKYDEILFETLSNSANTDDIEDYYQELCYDKIRLMLNAHHTYEYSYSVRIRDEIRRKHIKFCWLNSDKTDILVTRDDITEVFKKEQADKEKLNEALQSAEKANALKSEFLSNVSHDMRTPLNAILGYAKLAKQNDDLSVLYDYIDKVIKAGNTLSTLINDTLDLQKIERGVVTLKPEPINSEQMMIDVADAMRPIADQKGVTLNVDMSKAAKENVLVDHMRINEILINLVSNAIKFTPAGGKIDLILECVEKDDEMVHDKLIIKDNGIGMTADFVPKVFEPFSQERTEATADIGGSGLGLSIVKRLIEMMNGTIEVNSRLGEGTEFIIHINLQRTDEPALAKDSKAAVRKKLRGIKVLLCEDNAMNTEIARTLLEMQGIKVICAENGEEGVKIFLSSRENEFAAVLMDIRMPVMNGYIATKLIRASQHMRAKSVPIIAMSADAYEEDVQKCLASGMNEHISKPIEAERLYKTLEKYI